MEGFDIAAAAGHQQPWSKALLVVLLATEHALSEHNSQAAQNSNWSCMRAGKKKESRARHCTRFR